ncbi:MAG: CHAT domain-containing protein [Spirochaetia bacterium]|nr:CHAT domain-containing protein [Spirochaetia bacterium]
MLTTIIVDRVGNTNVFNVIQNDDRQIISESNSLQSITDDDLIQEYLSELTDISTMARSLTPALEAKNTDGTSMYQHMDIPRRLHQIGETFYRQFFPPAIQNVFAEKNNEYIYFHVDSKLASIPLEILSNGKYFLCEKFYIGKSVKGGQVSSPDTLPKDNLNMLIIADPTEDLAWARREGEELFEHLSTNFPEKKLQIELISGRHITKLSLLNDIVGKDLIHYSGHLHYTNDAGENGWVLYDDKIIHAREIQKSGASPLLIFSNSCVSGRDIQNKTSWYENFASSFLKSGKTNYIGTLWELPDTRQTLKFTLQLYDNIFQGHTVGSSLHTARIFAREQFTPNDLTWASYLLMGSPVTKIFQKESKLPDLSRNILDPEIVLKKYPFPIALAYQKAYAIVNSDKPDSIAEKFESLFNVFENTVLFLCSLIVANYSYLNISKPISFNPFNLYGTVNAAFHALKIMGLLKVENMIPHLEETMLTHKEEIFKIIDWRQQYDRGEIRNSSIEGYMISLQYLLERILIDIEYLKTFGFYRIVEPGIIQLSLYGLSEYQMMKEIILPTQTDSHIREELTIRTSALIGKCVFYIPVKRIFFDMSSLLDINISEGKDSALDYEVLFKEYSTANKMPAVFKKKRPSDDLLQTS